MARSAIQFKNNFTNFGRKRHFPDYLSTSLLSIYYASTIVVYLKTLKNAARLDSPKSINRPGKIISRKEGL
jgi:hypothetical protein